MSEPPNNANIRGEPLELDELLSIVIIDAADIESALFWWDENGNRKWRGALDSKPIEGE